MADFCPTRLSASKIRVRDQPLLFPCQGSPENTNHSLVFILSVWIHAVMEGRVSQLGRPSLSWPQTCPVQVNGCDHRWGYVSRLHKPITFSSI